MLRSLAALALIVALPVLVLAVEPAPNPEPGHPRRSSDASALPVSSWPASDADRMHLAQAPLPGTQAPGQPAAEEAVSLSPAERINRLQRTIEREENQLAKIKAERDDPNGEYARAKARFEEADKALQALKKAIRDLPAGDVAGRKAAEARAAEQEKLRTLAKNRFDLAIETRKYVAEQVANLEDLLRRDRQSLDRLQNVERPKPADPTAPAVSGNSVPPAPSPVAPSPNAPSVTVPTVPGQAPAASRPVASPGAGTTVATPGSAPSPAPSTGHPEAQSEELIAAEKDAQTKAAASKKAEERAQRVTDRLEALEKEITLEKRLLGIAKKQRDNETEARRDLNEAFRTRSMAGAPRAELDGLLDQVRRAERRLEAATEDAQEHVTRLEELQSERAALHTDQLAALQKAVQAKAQVKAAEETIRSIENPFRPRNVLLWLIDHGPKMLAVLLAMLVGHWFSKHFCERVILLIAQKGARGSSAEREDRARTLVGVFYNAASVAIFLGGGLMVLQEAGIPIAPLLGGAAVFGLAVAFGAQNLIRDYFYGFVVLLENQYKLNDVVKIGDLSGQVERITLRMTVLRDLEGQVHFIPNGQVTAVTNMTHGWSRALFAIGVAYKEDVDRVMAVLASLARELQADPQFGPLILEEATMLGVDELADSAVVIKFFIKTRPLQQWTVRRELLRRIKNRFDELGIEIPFPQRTVHHRTDVSAAVLGSIAGTPRIASGTNQV